MFSVPSVFVACQTLFLISCLHYAAVLSEAFVALSRQSPAGCGWQPKPRISSKKLANVRGSLRLQTKEKSEESMSRTVLSAAALLALLIAGGCGRAAAQRPAAEPAPAGQTESSMDYLVGPGDLLQIFVWDHADLSSSVQVRPDGKISTPLVEDLQAAGKAPTALARDIETVLAEYVRSPVVTVIVQGFVGAVQQQVRVVGQAVAPKALQYRQGMTVLDVIIEVGGLSEFASGNRARIIREVDGKRTEIRVRVDDLLNKGRTDRNVPMLPGDVLVIPESIL
jgi:polysaccharide export outer membrane protein